MSDVIKLLHALWLIQILGMVNDMYVGNTCCTMRKNVFVLIDARYFFPFYLGGSFLKFFYLKIRRIK